MKLVEPITPLLNGSSHKAEPIVCCLAISESLIGQVIEMARAYPYPHSMLGGPAADAYVRKLSGAARFAGEGWYVVQSFNRAVAAAHLSVYGVGSGIGHTLWKIRHPMLAADYPAEYLTHLFRGLSREAVRLRGGTAKLVMYLSEFEQDAITRAEQAGYELEARFKDYYRLNETCLVYGQTKGIR